MDLEYAQYLDMVLNLVSQNVIEQGGHNSSDMWFTNEIPFEKMTPIIHTLIGADYVSVLNNDKRPRLTTKGEIFFKSNGYTQIVLKQLKKEKRDKCRYITSVTISILAVLIAIGAAILPYLKSTLPKNDQNSTNSKEQVSPSHHDSTPIQLKTDSIKPKPPIKSIPKVTTKAHK